MTSSPEGPQQNERAHSVELDSVAGVPKMVKYLLAAVSTVAVMSTTLVAVNWLNQPVIAPQERTDVAAQQNRPTENTDEPQPASDPPAPPPVETPSVKMPVEPPSVEPSPPPADGDEKPNPPMPPASDSPESPEKPSRLATKKSRFRGATEPTIPADEPPGQPTKPKSPRSQLADDPLPEPEDPNTPVSQTKTTPKKAPTKAPRRPNEAPSREPPRPRREPPLPEPPEPPEPSLVVTRRRPPSIVVQQGGTGGVRDWRGAWTSQVVDPVEPVWTFSGDDVVDWGSTAVTRRRPVRPIDSRSSVDWERLLSSLLVEVVTRLDDPTSNSKGGSTGRLDATPSSFSGLTFVRRGVNGAPTHRLKFLDASNYQFEVVPLPGGNTNATPEKGRFTVVDQLLTLSPELRSQNVRRLTVSKYRLNADGKRTLQLGNDLWEQELASPPPSGLVATFDTLKGKVFTRTSVGNLQRLALGDDGSFVYVSASTDPQRRGAPMRVIRGKFSVSGKNLSLTRATNDTFPAPLADVWPIGDLQRGPDGKFILGLNREEWDEELPISATPIGPITPSAATIGGRTFTWTDNQGNNFQIDFWLNGAFTMRVINGARSIATSGVYEVAPNELRVIFRNSQAIGSLVNVNGPWPIQDYLMNVDGKRTIRMQAGLASSPEPIWSESP